jgi:hypothetical protein
VIENDSDELDKSYNERSDTKRSKVMEVRELEAKAD